MQMHGHWRLPSDAAPDDPLYLELIAAEKRWLSVNPGVADVYTVRKGPDGAFHFIVDSETDYDHSGSIDNDREERTAIGEKSETSDEEFEVALLGRPYFEDHPETDRWGTWVSAGVPLYDEAGKVEAVLGVDFPAAGWAEAISRARLGMTAYLAALLTILFAGAGLQIGYQRHLNQRAQSERKLREQASDLASAKLTIEASYQRLDEQNKDLAVAKIAADAANDAKTRFLASMSHEIRTPLNGIIGFADLLMRNADEGNEEQRAEWIGVIHGSSTHLLSLLNDVLDLSKLDVGKMDISPAPCSPRAVISESALIMQSRAEEKGLTLNLHFEPGVPEAIRTDGTRLRQIVMNLVGNAVKFTEKGGVEARVAFLASPSAGVPAMLRVSIADTGIGMTPEQTAALFNPFQQADHTIIHRFGGTGLGLAISKRLAERLGGDISVSSTRGVGSVFTLTLAAYPLLPGEFLPRTLPITDAWDSGKPGMKTPLAGRSILVADDVETNRKVCAIFLGRAGARVVLACNGHEAVELCRTQSFDLVLMDVQMPVMHGQDASRALRAAGFHMPIIALTAFSSGGDREDCLAAGMNDFLSKPIEPALMIQSAARWILQTERGTATAHDPALPTWESDPDLVAVARQWLAELPLKFDRVAAALADGDSETAARAAHAIKGTGGSLGCPEFTIPAETLESAAKAKSTDIAQLALAQLRRLHAAATARAGDSPAEYFHG
jgi:signal transduction histidine kinase/ActR/RegA family two-component response regulator